MNFEDSPCLGWLVFQRSAVTQLLGLAWGHPLPVSQGEEAPSGLDWGQSGLTAGSPATLGLPSTTVLSLTCHWTCSFSQGSPHLVTPGPAMQSACVTGPGLCTHSRAPGKVQGTPQGKGLCPGPRPVLPVCSWGGLAGLVSSARRRAS